MKVSNKEKGIIAIVRLNKEFPKAEIVKTWTLGRLKITYNWRSKKNLWGRFGGGWNWQVGIEIGGRTMIINCLIFSLRFDILKGESK